MKSVLLLQVLRDPSRPWGKDNYWIINPHSEYIFADGAFRRRRRRALKRGTAGEEQGPSAGIGVGGYHRHHHQNHQRDGDTSFNHHHHKYHHHYHPPHHLLPHSVAAAAAAAMSRYNSQAAGISRIPPTSHPHPHPDIKPASAFTIDNILKTSADEHLKHLRDWTRNMDILRSYHQMEPGTGSSARPAVIQVNPRSLPLQQLLTHLPYPPPWPLPSGGAIPSMGASGGAGVQGGIPFSPVTQAAYLEALNRWFLSTARLGTSMVSPEPLTPTSQSTCVDPQCNCTKS